MAIKSRAITAGDPVTAEIINNLIIDLEAVNKQSTAQSIILDNTQEEGNKQAVSGRVWSEGLVECKINPNDYPSGTVTVTFPKGLFTKAPRVWLQVNVNKQKLSQGQLRIHPTTFSVTKDKAVFYIRSGSGGEKATLFFDVFATDSI
jgi:hypothetical protein